MDAEGREKRDSGFPKQYAYGSFFKSGKVEQLAFLLLMEPRVIV